MTCFCTQAQAKNFGLLALRVTLGVVFLYHGWMKLQDIPTTAGFFGNFGIPAAMFFAYVVGLLEFVGGIALILGVQVKTFAGLLAIMMLVALLGVHTRMPYASAELALLAFGGALSLFGSGGGDWRMSKKECVCEMKK